MAKQDPYAQRDDSLYSAAKTGQDANHAKATDLPLRTALTRAWSHRRLAAGGVDGSALLRHPVRLGFGLLTLLTIALFAAQAALGRVPFGDAGYSGDVLVALLHGVLLAYVVAAYFAVLRQAARTVDALRPKLASLGPSGAVIALPPLALPTLGWIAAGLAGGAFGFIGPYLTEPHLSGPLGFWQIGAWIPEVYWHRLLGLIVSVWSGWFVFAVLQVSRQLSRLALELREVDIFDLQPLRPFAQQGLTNGLLAAGFLSLLLLFALDQGLTWMLLLFGGVATGVVGAAILLPAVGVHRRITAEKQAELAWCEVALQRERGALRHDRVEREPGRLADLLAYRALVQQVREWPFDTPAVRRMVLFLLIPLGSWVASAIVQHLVEGLLPLR